MSSNPFDLIIFDWDGTLIDSVRRIVSSMQAAARHAELTVPSDADVRNIIGLSLPAVYERLFKGASQESLDALKEEYRRQFVEGDTTPAPLFEGAREILEHLQNQNIRLAVATGKARYGLERSWNEVGVGHLFDASRCSDEAEGKPHPQMVLDLLAHTKTPAHRALVIGDTAWDMEMAKRADVARLGVTYGAHAWEELVPHDPLDALHKIGDLQNWLKARMNQVG